MKVYCMKRDGEECRSGVGEYSTSPCTAHTSRASVRGSAPPAGHLAPPLHTGATVLWHVAGRAFRFGLRYTLIPVRSSTFGFVLVPGSPTACSPDTDHIVYRTVYRFRILTSKCQTQSTVYRLQRYREPNRSARGVALKPANRGARSARSGARS